MTNVQNIAELEETLNKKMNGDARVSIALKNYMRYKEAADHFSMGERTFMDLAKEAGAVRKIKGVCLVNIDIVSRYIEDMYS